MVRRKKKYKYTKKYINPTRKETCKENWKETDWKQHGKNRERSKKIYLYRARKTINKIILIHPVLQIPDPKRPVLLRSGRAMGRGGNLVLRLRLLHHRNLNRNRLGLSGNLMIRLWRWWDLGRLVVPHGWRLILILLLRMLHHRRPSRLRNLLWLLLLHRWWRNHAAGWSLHRLPIRAVKTENPKN